LKEDPIIYDGLGQCYLAKREFEEANSFFADAILKDPTNIQFLRNRDNS
jgi:uncharacterized protein HemY